MTFSEGGSADSGEVRITDPVTGGAKGEKPARFSLLPWDVLWQDSEHYAKGGKKYEDRNWERGYQWHLSYDAALRHMVAFWQMRQSHDPENGSHHLVAARFHLAAMIRYDLNGLGTDDRPKP